tara:strand:- start:87 stop:548 length:462 start_codon:yes stop_codon:yes gene_type:complete
LWVTNLRIHSEALPGPDAADAWTSKPASCCPGAWELQKPPFQITHKIRQKTASFTGINNVIQSIFASLSHSTFRFTISPSLRQLKKMADFRQPDSLKLTGSRAGILTLQQIRRKPRVLLGEFGSFSSCAPGARETNHPQPPLSSGSIRGVWEL